MKDSLRSIKLRARDYASIAACAASCGMACGCADGAETEAVASVSSRFSVPACVAQDATDHQIEDNWPEQAIYSDKVDLLNTDDPSMYIYNAYTYDYSGVCPNAFVTDVLARPLGNPAMTWRATIKQGAVTGTMTQARCDHIYFEIAVYGQHFNGNSQWYHLYNNYIHGTFANGRCSLPVLQSRKIDWKDGYPGFGKLDGMRWVISAGEGDTLLKTCLAIDGDDQGDHLNALCPILTI